MSNLTVEIMGQWRIRLSGTVPRSQAELRKLLELPDENDTETLRQLGFTEVVVRGVLCPQLSASFSEPIPLADIEAVFGEWTSGTHGPGLNSDSPRCYNTNGPFSTRFTFFCRYELASDPVSGSAKHTEYCWRLLISVGEPPKPTFQNNVVKPPPVSRWRRWFRRRSND
jgi:hypothetical protein